MSLWCHHLLVRKEGSTICSSPFWQSDVVQNGSKQGQFWKNILEMSFIETGLIFKLFGLNLPIFYSFCNIVKKEMNKFIITVSGVSCENWWFGHDKCLKHFFFVNCTSLQYFVANNTYIIHRTGPKLLGLFLLLLRSVYYKKMETNKCRTRAIISHGLHIFYPIFHGGLYFRAVSITNNLCTKQGNSSILEPKIRGL